VPIEYRPIENHHTHPNVVKTGLAGWEIDVTWWAIAVLNTLALAKKAVMPQP
jgi:stearoyl-CoA desaturase (delta-9 desaturase)